MNGRSVMLIRIVSILCAVIFPAVTVFAQDNSAAADPDTSKVTPAVAQPEEKSTSPDEDAFVCARGGIGYYRWSLAPIEGKFDAFSDYNQMSYDIDPVVAKNYEVTANILFLQGGLNYVTSSLREWGGWGKSDDSESTEKKSTLMRRLDLFAGLRYGDCSIKTDFSIRVFSGNMRSNGSATGLPVIYYTRRGDRVNVPRGTRLNWKSTYQQYSIRFVQGGSRSGLCYEMGGQYVRYQTPTLFNITPSQTYTTNSPILIQSTVEQYSIVLGGHARKFFTGNLYLDVFMPTTLGCSRFTNSFFKVGPGFNTYTTTYTADVSLRYVSDYARFDIGANWNFVMSYSYAMKDISLRRDIAMYNSSDVETTIPKGTKVRVSCMHDEIFYGLYAQASLYF